jgi:hypothetical protein
MLRDPFLLLGCASGTLRFAAVVSKAQVLASDLRQAGALQLLPYRGKDAKQLAYMSSQAGAVASNRVSAIVGINDHLQQATDKHAICVYALRPSVLLVGCHRQAGRHTGLVHTLRVMCVQSLLLSSRAKGHWCSWRCRHMVMHTMCWACTTKQVSAASLYGTCGGCGRAVPRLPVLFCRAGG